MDITITINLDNSAFEDCNGNETARILRKLADTLDETRINSDFQSPYPLRDLNGNKVGHVEVKL